MSFFRIVDVVMNTNRNRLGGPTSLGGDAYKSNTFRFPEDVGNYDKGHYILFNINEQTNTQFPATRGSSGLEEPTVIANMRKLQAIRGSTNVAGVVNQGIDVTKQAATAVAGSSAVQNPNVQRGISFVKDELDKLGSIPGARFATGTINSAVDSITSITGEKFLRTIRRTTDTIALYMPDTLRFTYGQSYRPLELGSGPLAAGAAFASSAYNTVKSENTLNTSNFALNIAAGLSGQPILKALATAATGLVNNPMLEVIYSSPRFREFSFNFMLYPRSEKEAKDVQNILSRFRFHQAPEIKDNTGGFFLIPPSEFDISFMYNGRPNPNIDKISTCVLTNISVDYAPKGFQTYEVGGENDAKLGRTGMPIGIGLSLTFMETQILTKEYHDNYSRTLGQASVVNSINNEFALNEAGRVKDNTGSE